MAGVDAARAVWRCPGMQKALQGLLQGPAGSLPSDRAAELSASALITVRMLASSDAQLFTVVVSSGSPLYAMQKEVQFRWQYTGEYTNVHRSALTQLGYIMLDGSQCTPRLSSVHKECH